MELAKDFVFTSHPEIPLRQALRADQLGPLHLLPGVWKGHGFNQIWRPFNVASNPTGNPPPPPNQDRFLELNLTNETLQFEEIPGKIPNRGLLQIDINLFGLTYLQQISDHNVGGGIHVEPGIWVNVQSTTAPAEVATVVRMASIPHGTTIEAQGTAKTINGPPVFAPVSITPFTIGNPAALHPFLESDLNTATLFRSPNSPPPSAQLANITQAMVDNPNSVLLTAIQGQNILETTILSISSTLGIVPDPNAGGGVANIAFLTGNSPPGPNALAAELDATFWIETVKEPSGKTFHQLQYTQRVLLNFNTLSWPHVSVATLKRHPA